MIATIVRLLLGPLLKLGEKHLDNQKDKTRLEHGTRQAAYKADSAVRQVKLLHWMGRAPLFIAEVSCAFYLAAIMIDSTWPSDYIDPLELPGWFKPHFTTLMWSIFGIATGDRLLRSWK